MYMRAGCYSIGRIRIKCLSQIMEDEQDSLEEIKERRGEQEGCIPLGG